MGCEVVVLSHSEDKKNEAMRLGAKHFIATKGQKELKVDRPIDRLLVTTAINPDWNLVLPIMAAESKILPLTVRATFQTQLEPNRTHILTMCHLKIGHDGQLLHPADGSHYQRY